MSGRTRHGASPELSRYSVSTRGSPIHAAQPHRRSPASARAMTGQLVVLLHLCDSLFPIGSFAHSDGLEAATSRGDVRTASDLRAWMDVVLWEVLRRVEGPAVRRSWEAVMLRQFESVITIDDEVYALRAASAGRESTRAMGGRLLKTWQRLRPCDAVQ